MSLAMPAEWAPHERTLMCWPARESMWEEHFAQAEEDYAAVANAIVAFEPVLMAVDPRFAPNARRSPISRVRSFTDTSRMFISPIPPIASVSIPMNSSSTCNPIVKPSIIGLIFDVPNPVSARLSDAG